MQVSYNFFFVLAPFGLRMASVGPFRGPVREPGGAGREEVKRLPKRDVLKCAGFILYIWPRA